MDGARAVGCEVVMPHKAMLSDQLRERVRSAGLRLATWVVDDPEELGEIVQSLLADARGRTGMNGKPVER